MFPTYGPFRHRTLGTCMYRNRLAIASHLYACARGWRVRYAVVLGGRSSKSSKSLMSAGTTNIWIHKLVDDLLIIWIHKVEHALIYEL